MRYVKFTTPEAAEAYRAQLQAYHDQGRNLDTTKPKIVDCVCPTYDGQFALTLQDEDQTADDLTPVELPPMGRLSDRSRIDVAPAVDTPPVGASVPDVGDGEIVDTLEPTATDEVG